MSFSVPDAFPAVLDDISPVFLTEKMRAAGFLKGTAVQSIQIMDRFAGSGMTSQIGRIRIIYDRELPDAARTAIVKLPSAVAETRKYFSKWGYYEREVLFYSLMDEKLTFRTPRCYASSFDTNSGLSLLVLEDLDGLDNQVTPENCSAERAEILIRMLAKFHAAWWEQPVLIDFDWLYRYDSRVDQSMVEATLQNWNRFCLAIGDHKAPVMDAIATRVAGFPQAKAAQSNRPPLTMIHGDFQFPNLFFDPHQPNAEPVVTDFQFVSHTCGPSSDLAFFISTCLEYQVRKSCETRLLDVYYSTLIEQGVHDYPYSMFMDDYRFGLFNCMMRLSMLVAGGYIKDPNVLMARLHRYCTVIEDNQAWNVLEEVH